MNVRAVPAVADSNPAGQLVPETEIAELVGRVYETAPIAERSRLVSHLIRPLGVLGLFAVANGIFAKVWFRSSYPDLQVRPEDAQNVRTSDVIALVDYLQQARVETVDGLAQWLGTSPVLVGSAAAALLVSLLVQRASHRRVDDGLTDDLSMPRV